MGPGHVAKWCTAPSAQAGPFSNMRSYAQVTRNVEIDAQEEEIIKRRGENEQQNIEDFLRENSIPIVESVTPIEQLTPIQNTANRRQTLDYSELEAFRRKPVIPRSPPKDRVFGTDPEDFFQQPKETQIKNRNASRSNENNKEQRNSSQSRENNSTKENEEESNRGRKKKRNSPEGEKKKPNTAEYEGGEIREDTTVRKETKHIEVGKQ